MSFQVDAIFDDGVLKPLAPLVLPNQTRVTITVDALPTPQGTGAELVAYWQREGLVGGRPELADSQERARQVRSQAERRERP